jgi:hypothetical protein
MQDLLWQLKDTDSFTIYTAGAFTLAIFWFIREIVDAPMLAVVSAPVIMVCSVLSPLLFRTEMITLSYDTEANTAATVAMGSLAGLVVIVVFKWLSTLIVERQARQAKIAAVTASSRIRR